MRGVRRREREKEGTYGGLLGDEEQSWGAERAGDARRSGGQSEEEVEEQKGEGLPARAAERGPSRPETRKWRFRIFQEDA